MPWHAIASLDARRGNWNIWYLWLIEFLQRIGHYPLLLPLDLLQHVLAELAINDFYLLYWPHFDISKHLVWNYYSLLLNCFDAGGAGRSKVDALNRLLNHDTVVGIGRECLNLVVEIRCAAEGYGNRRLLYHRLYHSVLFTLHLIDWLECERHAAAHRRSSVDLHHWNLCNSLLLRYYRCCHLIRHRRPLSLLLKLVRVLLNAIQ